MYLFNVYESSGERHLGGPFLTDEDRNRHGFAAEKYPDKVKWIGKVNISLDKEPKLEYFENEVQG